MVAKISTNLYSPPTKDRYIYISKRNCNRYIACAKTPYYRKTKLFDTLEECHIWIEWFLKNPLTEPESIDDHSVRFAESQV